MIFPDNFEKKIDFERIRQLITEECLSHLGRKHIKKMKFTTHFSTIKMRLEETAEFVQILDEDTAFPIENYYDLDEFLDKLRIQGAFVEAVELHKLYKLLITAKAIVRFFSNESADEKYPNLKGLAESIEVPVFVMDSIKKIITAQGKIKDSASPDLAKVRQELASKQGGVSKLINRIIVQAQQDGWVDTDVAVSIRNGRVVIPIQASFKRKIQGIIHDESATGKTCFVEPLPVVELNNQIAELETEEKRQIVKILQKISEEIRPYADDLEDTIVLLGIIDFTRAKAKFALKINAVLPILKNQTLIDWKEAKHPLLFLSLKNEGKEVVPLNLMLTQENRILVISGPNAGGKSVCLKTTGLLQYMLQCGLLIPVNEKSVAGIFQHIFIDIGDEQSIDNDLSTYSSHLLNMKYFSQKADEKTLILIDEFGTGTEPNLGGAIAEAVLEKLNKIKTFGVVTTHYANLKHFASQQNGVFNGAMLYDTQKLEPLFQLEVGKPGSSFALEIAHKIGLPNEIIDAAKEKVGQEHIDFDKHLKELLKDKRYWERKRLNIRKIERRLEEMMEKEKVELEETNLFRKQMLEQTENQAKKILEQSNKIIENTVREIKEAEAEKEKTKEVRKKIRDFKEEIEKKQDKEQEKINQKIKKLKEREKKIQRKPKQKPSLKNKIQQPTEWSVGMLVRIKGQEQIGEIIQIKSKNASVAFGNLITNLSTEKLEYVENNGKQKGIKKKGSQYFQQQMELGVKKLKFKPYLDIRGKRGEEAIRQVGEFVDEAIMVGANELKILHGTGNGILRQLVRQYLFTVDMVKEVKDEHIESGGTGITVVTMH